MKHIFRVRPDAAQDAEHRLDEKRRPHQPAFQEMGEIVEMRSVVAFELETGAAIAQCVQDELDVLERVAEDEVA